MSQRSSKSGLFLVLSGLVLFVVTPSAFAAVPTISSLSPNSTAVGTATPFTVTVVGTNFDNTSPSTVFVNNVPRATTFIDATHVSFDFTGSELNSATSYSIKVVNTLVI